MTALLSDTLSNLIIEFLKKKTTKLSYFSIFKRKIVSTRCVLLLHISMLGRGFSKLYKPYMSDFGTQATTYFDFKRHKNLTIKFRDIVRRTYTPFLIAMKNPSNAEEFPAQVYNILNIFFF